MRQRALSRKSTIRKHLLLLSLGKVLLKTLSNTDAVREKLISKIDYPLDGVIEVTDEQVKEKWGQPTITIVGKSPLKPWVEPLQQR